MLFRSGGKQGAARAVNDLLHDGKSLGDGRGYKAQAGHHGIHWSDACHQTKTGVKIYGKETKKIEILLLDKTCQVNAHFKK